MPGLDTVLWLDQGVLGVVFLGAGLLKLVKSHDALKADPHMGWAHDYSAGFIKFLGGAEAVGAVGMTVPWLTGILPVLTPIAATALAVLMVGATAAHVRRSEWSMALATVALTGAAVFVAYGRFALVPMP